MWRGPWHVSGPPQSWRPDKLPFKQTLTHQPVATVSVSECQASADRSHSALPFHSVPPTPLLAFTLLIIISCSSNVHPNILSIWLCLICSCWSEVFLSLQLALFHQADSSTYACMSECRNKPLTKTKLFGFGLHWLECIRSTHWQLKVRPCPKCIHHINKSFDIVCLFWHLPLLPVFIFYTTLHVT